MAGGSRHKILPKNGAFADLNVATPTTITTGGTYQYIEGVFNNTPIKKFIGVAGPPPGLQYQGAETLFFEIDWHAAAAVDSNGKAVHVGIAKNGEIPETSSIMGTFMKTANEPQAFSGTIVVELSYGDIITIVTTSTDDNDIVTFNHFTTTIRPFFDR